MKKQIQMLMAQKKLDAILISGSREHNPFLTYFVGDAFFTQADVLVMKDREPLLFYRVMERDTAAMTSLQGVCYNDLEVSRYRDCTERTNTLLAVLRYAGMTSGRIAFCGRIEFNTAYQTILQLQNKLPDLEFVGGLGDEILNEARYLKDPSEIEKIREMCGIVTTVVGRVENFISSKYLHDGVLMGDDGTPVTIGKVKSLINLWLGELGAENPEGTIFSQGRDAGVPHNQGNDADVLQAGKSIVYDFFPCGMGGGYFGDFTRTWCIGWAPDEVKEAYAEVKEIHDLLAEKARSGMKFKDLQQMTCDYFKSHGHITIDEDVKVTNGYMHSVGHGVGLNIHERPFSSKTASEKDLLLPGAVFTIEPGLYYPDKPEGYGVRIEDTYYMNEDGKAEALTEYPYRLIIDVPAK